MSSLMSESEMMSDHPLLDAGDYCQCAGLLRAYITRYILPSDVEKAATYSFSKEPYKLTVIMHPQIAMVKRVKLSRLNHSIGIVGIWHHGIEELFLVQNMLGQASYRSLRQTQSATIERGLRWLCLNLARWQGIEA